MQLYEDHASIVYTLAFSLDGEFLASGAKAGTLVVRDSCGMVVSSNDPSEPAAPPIQALTYLADGSLVVGHAHGWHLQRRSATHWPEIGPSRSSTTGLAQVNDRILAVGSGDRARGTAGKLELWDIVDGRRLEPYFLEAHGVRAVAACREKNLVAWVSSPRNVRVCDIRRQTPTEFAQPAACQSIALDAEARTLVVALDRPVRVFDLPAKRERLVLKGHTGRVEAVAISPDGSRIASGSWDHSVRLWDAASGRELTQFHWQLGKIYSLAFAPDGQRLAAGTDTGRVVVWDVD